MKVRVNSQMKKWLLAGVAAVSVANVYASDAKLTNVSGVITVGYREASVPFSYLDAQKKPIGYSMDLCSHVVEALKKNMGPEVKVNYVPVSSSDRMEKIKSGLVDIECGTTSVTKPRLLEVAFSNPIFFVDTKILVRTDSGIHSVADLKDKRVIVIQGSTGGPMLAKVDMEKGLHIQFSKAHDNAESFKMLQEKKVDAFVHDDILLAVLAAGSADPKNYVLLGESLSSDTIGIMMRKENKPLKQLVDATLSSLNASGELAKIYAKWFVTPTLKVPMSEALKNEWKKM